LAVHLWPNIGMNSGLALTRQQVRRVDQLAVEQLGIAGVVLMENAGRNAAQRVLELLRQRRVARSSARVAVVCGGGNNGGDGYVVARHLHNAGVTVTLCPARDPAALTGDAMTNCLIATRMGLPMQMARDASELADASGNWDVTHVIVDALLGTGFTGTLRPPMAAVIDRINAAGRWEASVVAMDLPSGLDCDTGQPADPTIRADLTVTFVGPKVGFDRPSAREHLGQVVVADIGVPEALIEQARRETPAG
jgi:NAD(P)H-hydrate epimerase